MYSIHVRQFYTLWREKHRQTSQQPSCTSYRMGQSNGNLLYLAEHGPWRFPPSALPVSQRQLFQCTFMHYINECNACDIVLTELEHFVGCHSLVFFCCCKLALAVNHFTVPPTPSRGPWPWQVAKKCPTQLGPKSLS